MITIELPESDLREAYMGCVIGALRDYWDSPSEENYRYVKYALEDFRKVAWRNAHKEK